MKLTILGCLYGIFLSTNGFSIITWQYWVSMLFMTIFYFVGYWNAVNKKEV